jgi:hypothetical protein
MVFGQFVNELIQRAFTIGAEFPFSHDARNLRSCFMDLDPWTAILGNPIGGSVEITRSGEFLGKNGVRGDPLGIDTDGDGLLFPPWVDAGNGHQDDDQYGGENELREF